MKIMITGSDLEETVGDKMRYWEDALKEYIENLNQVI